MGRKVLILHLPQLEGRRYSSKEGELVGCFKRKLTHFLGDLKFSTTATLGPGLGGLVPFPVTSPLPPQTLKEHARGFQLFRSARVSCLPTILPGEEGPEASPFPLPLCDAASWRSLSPGERHHSAGAPATGPPNPPPLALSILTSGGNWEAWEHLSRLLSRGQRAQTQGQRGDNARVCRQGPGGAALIAQLQIPTLVWRLRLARL